MALQTGNRIGKHLSDAFGIPTERLIEAGPTGYRGNQLMIAKLLKCGDEAREAQLRRERERKP